MMKCPIMSSWARGSDNLPTLLALTSKRKNGVHLLRAHSNFMPCIIFTINNEIRMMMIKERSTRREKNNEVKLNTFLITKP